MSQRTEQVSAMTALAELPGEAVVYKTDLARGVRCSERTIERMVKRGELPAPMTFHGRAAWLVETILAHMRARMLEAAERAAAERKRLAQYSR